MQSILRLQIDCMHGSKEKKSIGVILKTRIRNINTLSCRGKINICIRIAHVNATDVGIVTLVLCRDTAYIEECPHQQHDTWRNIHLALIMGCSKNSYSGCGSVGDTWQAHAIYLNRYLPSIAPLMY